MTPCLAVRVSLCISNYGVRYLNLTDKICHLHLYCIYSKQSTLHILLAQLCIKSNVLFTELRNFSFWTTDHRQLSRSSWLDFISLPFHLHSLLPACNWLSDFMNHTFKHQMQLYPRTSKEIDDIADVAYSGTSIAGLKHIGITKMNRLHLFWTWQTR